VGFRQKLKNQGVAALAVSVLLVAAPSHAGPGFIAASHVKRGDVYTEVSVQLRCNAQYVGHDPGGKSDVVRIRLELTTVCAGAPPTIALSREQHRPPAADLAMLDSIEYDGQSPGAEILRLNFVEEVRFDVVQDSRSNWITIRVFPQQIVEATAAVAPPVASRMVRRPDPPPTRYVVNLESSQRPPASADLPSIKLPDDRKVFVSEAMIDGAKWYRVRVGYYGSTEEAAKDLKILRGQYPGAWIARDPEGPVAAPEVRSNLPIPVAEQIDPTTPAVAATDTDKLAALMADARRAMTAGELSKAVQIYTKVLQQQPNSHQPEAQEFLALARERNGQIAHAKAEYQRYLDVYPDAEGTDRVRQRLTALLATRGSIKTATTVSAGGEEQRQVAKNNPWSIRTFLSQYYRRDANQVNDEEQIVNQSSIYSDLSIDARRRGERFDLSTRLTAGYRSDLMSDTERSGSGNDFRLSYAYADLADSRTGLRGRLGRQTRNTGGVLGRFDGLNMTYAMNERLRFEAVAGQPVYSTSKDSIDSRSFYGVSSTFAPFSDALDIGVFYLQQDIDGLTDRQAVGAELRYFGAEQSLWGIVNYDTEFDELGSVFLQGSWRLPADFTVTGLVDSRRSPFLSLGNALIGQPVQDFTELRVLFTEDEIRQFALDRSPEVTTYSMGMSRPFSPKLQINLNASRSTVAATPESAGVAATEDTEYSYYSADTVLSSMFTEGDVGIVGLRYAVSESTDVYSINLDTRFPIGRSWRINPRLRVDYREIKSDSSTQWIYTPALRVQYRMGRRLRLEFQGGKQFSQREMTTTDLDRESYFINIGYQYFY
jgi:tetratricopeptide (TPR) repeat protein